MDVSQPIALRGYPRGVDVSESSAREIAISTLMELAQTGESEQTRVEAAIALLEHDGEA